MTDTEALTPDELAAIEARDVPKISKGEEFYAPTMGAFITVKRVAKDRAWADIYVEQPSTGATWSKRQPLLNQTFAFEVRGTR